MRRFSSNNYCCFCGASAETGSKLIKGPSGQFICTDCVKACQNFLANDAGELEPVELSKVPVICTFIFFSFFLFQILLYVFHVLYLLYLLFYSYLEVMILLVDVLTDRSFLLLFLYINIYN